MKVYPLLAALALCLPAPAGLAQDIVQSRDDKQNELEQVRGSLEKLAERRKALRAEIDALDNDQAAINRALIEAAKRGQDLEALVSESESKLASLNETRGEIRQSLSAKRALLSEVIAALQRMGRNPPPAILIRPRDAVSSIRSAIMLGAVVPEIRAEAETLVVELEALAQTTQQIEREQASLAESLNALSEDETRLTLLIEEKNQLAESSRQKLSEDAAQAERLGEKAQSLEQLIGSLEKRIASAEEGARQAREAEARRRNEAEQRLADARKNLDTLRKKQATSTAALLDPDKADNARIEPAIAFSRAKGALPIPVRGVELYGFGKGRRNVAIATRANARVRSPADGWVVYSGPFRSFGEVLILNAGSGYHIVLSGLSQTDVPVGRFVLAGEPVGRMGVTRVAAAAPVPLGSDRPVLYIEFRKNGTPINPAPWWAAGWAGTEGPDNES